MSDTTQGNGMRGLLGLLVALGLTACTDPFDPWAWRVETITVCVASPADGLRCENRRCEVRGPNPWLPPGVSGVVNDEREFRNCVTI